MGQSSKKMLIAVLLAVVLRSAAIWAQSPADFSGTWKQDNQRCDPPRKGDVTLVIEQRDPKLTVETTIVRASADPRHALQQYTTDGKESVSTGADGDEFHTSVVLRERSLVFTIEEHEEGRILHSKETWSLIDGGSALKRVREDLDRGGQRVLIYDKVSPK